MDDYSLGIQIRTMCDHDMSDDLLARVRCYVWPIPVGIEEGLANALQAAAMKFLVDNEIASGELIDMTTKGLPS